MSYKCKIKLGSITNLSDARYAAAAGIDYIGFCFDPSRPAYIPPIRAREIIDWTTGSNTIGEFGEQAAAEINDITELLGLDVIELNNSLLPDELKLFHKPVIKKIEVDAFPGAMLKKELDAYAPYADAFLLYGNTAGVEPGTLKDHCASYKIFWGFPVTAENVNDPVTAFHPYAIALSGGEEEKAGVKEFDELDQILEMLSL